MNIFKLSLFSSAFLFTEIPLTHACDPTSTASDISSTPSTLSPIIPSSIAEEDDIEWDNIQLPNFLERVELEEAKTDYTKIYNLVGTSLARHLLNGKIYIAYDVHGEGNNCLFETLGLTRLEVKEKLTHILLNAQDSKHLPIRYMLACDLWASFVEGRLPPLLQDKFKDLIQRQQEINKNYQNEEQDALWQLVKQRSLKLDICQTYLDYLLAPESMIAMGGFTRQEGESAEIKRRQFSLMDAIAYAFNIAIEVYREPRLPSSPLLLSQSFIFEGFERFIRILSKEIHYVPLIPEKVELAEMIPNLFNSQNGELHRHLLPKGKVITFINEEETEQTRKLFDGEASIIIISASSSQNSSTSYEAKKLAIKQHANNLVENYFSAPPLKREEFRQELIRISYDGEEETERKCALKALVKIKELLSDTIELSENLQKRKREEDESQNWEGKGKGPKRQRLTPPSPSQAGSTLVFENMDSEVISEKNKKEATSSSFPTSTTVGSSSLSSLLINETHPGSQIGREYVNHIKKENHEKKNDIFCKIRKAEESQDPLQRELAVNFYITAYSLIGQEVGHEYQENFKEAIYKKYRIGSRLEKETMGIVLKKLGLI